MFFINSVFHSISCWWQDFRDQSKILTTRKGLFIVSGFTVLAFAGAAIPGRLVFSQTESVGYRLFWHKKHFELTDLQKDTFVLFDMYTKLVPDCRPCLVVKKIACTEGELLTVQGNHFYCEGEYVATAKPNTKDGISLELFKFEGRIPPNNLFLAGTCVDSYDSRYIGFIEKNDIKALALPII
ncbi:MAG: S26 family signal peptidase [Desulfobacteria bacterium]